MLMVSCNRTTKIRVDDSDWVDDSDTEKDSTTEDFMDDYGDADSDYDTVYTDTDTDIETDHDPDTNMDFGGKLAAFGSNELPVPDIYVVALENDSAYEIPDMMTQSGPEGSVFFSGLPGNSNGLVGFKAIGKPLEYVDTYQFNIPEAGQNQTLWVVPFATFKAAPLIAGITVNAAKAIAMGGVYWMAPNESRDPVGCAVVETVSSIGTIRYFGNNNLPATIEEQPNINPDNGMWIAANLKPGLVTIQVKVGPEIVGTTTFHGFPGEAITLADIYIDKRHTTNTGLCK